MPAKKAAATPPPSSMKALRDKMSKRYGERVMRRDQVVPYQVIPTGSLGLDMATRVGGWVRGRTHEVMGPEGVGKTTVCISSAVEAQTLWPDLSVGLIDMEQTFDYDWAEANGLDTSDDRWLHVYPDDSEDVSDQIKQMASTGLFSLIFVDSIGSMESKGAFEKDAGESNMGKNSQIITRMCKQVSVLCRRNKVAVIFVNQPRANFSQPGGADVSAGPKSLRHNTTMKVQMSRTGESPLKARIDGEDETVAYQMRARVVRNKVAPQGRSADFWIMNQPTPEFGPVGISRADEAITIGLYTEVIQQGGAWYTLPDGTRVNGRPKLLQHLASCPDDVEMIRKEALATVSGEVQPETVVEFEQEAAG